MDALAAHSAPVLEVAWSGDESRVASADKRGTVVVWQAQPPAAEDEAGGSDESQELGLAPRSASV